MALTEQEIRQLIEALSRQVNDLYQAWTDIDRRRDKIRQDYADKIDPVAEEALDRIVTNLDAENEHYGSEYERLKSELDDLYDQLDELVPERKSRNEATSPLELEKTSLHRRLNEIADEQNDAISKWNLDPIEESKTAFEQQLQRLHDEFSQILVRLDELDHGKDKRSGHSDVS